MASQGFYPKSPEFYTFVLLTAALLSLIISVFLGLNKYWFNGVSSLIVSVGLFISYALYRWGHFKLSLSLFIITATLAPVIGAIGYPKELSVPVFYAAALIPFVFVPHEYKNIFRFGMILPFIGVYITQTNPLFDNPSDNMTAGDIQTLHHLILLGTTSIALIALVALRRILVGREEKTLLEKHIILDMMSEGLCYLNEKGKIGYVNQAGKKILGLHEIPAFKLHIQEILHFDRAGKSSSGGHPFTFFEPEKYHRGLFFNSKGDRIPLEFSLRPLAHRSVPIRGRIIIFRDITSQLETQNQLIQSAKMSEIGHISAGIAHEINNPLNVIQLVVEKLIDEGINNKDIRHIEQMSIRIQNIVNSLLKLAHDDKAPDFNKDFKANELFVDLVNLTRERLKRQNIGLILEDRSLNKKVKGNRTLISQVLLNLINNSYQAILDLDKKWVRLTIDTNDTHVLFKMTDSGPGIPKDIQKNIFSPFFTTKKMAEGTGLGLALSLKIIKNQNGLLYLNDNHPNTQFVLALPST